MISMGLRRYHRRFEAFPVRVVSGGFQEDSYIKWLSGAFQMGYGDHEDISTGLGKFQGFCLSRFVLRPLETQKRQKKLCTLNSPAWGVLLSPWNAPGTLWDPFGFPLERPKDLLHLLGNHWDHQEGVPGCLKGVDVFESCRQFQGVSVVFQGFSVSLRDT